MRILFAISLVALAALIWASVSIAQHIHRSRRRRRQTFDMEESGALRTSTEQQRSKPPTAAASSVRPDSVADQSRKAS